MTSPNETTAPQSSKLPIGARVEHRFTHARGTVRAVSDKVSTIYVEYDGKPKSGFTAEPAALFEVV
jgi:hypothetical protein